MFPDCLSFVLGRFCRHLYIYVYMIYLLTVTEIISKIINSS